MTMSYEEIRRYGCYHEAGHAVHARLIAGWELRYVSVETEEYPDLRDYCALRVPRYADYVPTDLAVNSLVGVRAAWFWSPGYPFKEPFEEFVENAEDELEEDPELAGDRGDALVRMRRLQEAKVSGCDAPPWGSTLEEIYYNLCEQAQQFVENFWTDIEAVAVALEEQGYLDGDTVDALLEE